MLKFHRNPDTFASEIPDDFQPTGFILQHLEEFSEDIDATAPEVERPKKNDVEKRPKKKKETKHVARADNLGICGNLDRPSIIVDNSLNLPEEQSQTDRPNNQPIAGTSGNGSSRTEPYRVEKKRCLFEGLVTVTRPTPDDVLLDVNEFDLESHTTGTLNDSFEDIVITTNYRKANNKGS